MRRWLIALVALIMLAAGAAAQEDGLNLPTELYTLKRDGRIERFGLGAAGVADVTPPGALTVDFGVSPDGVWLVYRTDSAVGLYNMRTGEQRALDTTGASFPPYRGRGQSIAWSPDGGAIAYTTETGLRVAFLTGGFADVVISPLLDLVWSPDGTYLAAEAESDVWWVYRRINDPPQVALHSAIPSSRGLTWANNTQLLFAPAEGGLYMMDVANANQQAALDDSANRYSLPQRRQDGTVALFVRPSGNRNITDTAGYLWQIAAGPVLEQVSQQSVELSGMRWTPDGRLLTTLSGGVFAVVDPVSAQGFPLPMTDVAAYGWGALRLPSVPNLPLTSNVYFLGDDGTGIMQVWRLPADGSAPVALTAHDAAIESYDVAPDGRTVAYVSAGTLWVMTPDPDVATPILTAEGISAPVFNADGTRITYQMPDGIYLIDAQGGEPQLVLADYAEPQFAGENLLVRIPDGDLALFTIETGDVQRLGSFMRAKPLPDGRILGAGAPASDMETGIYLMGAGSAPVLLYRTPPGLRIRDFAPLIDGSVRLLMERADGLPAPVRVFDISTTGAAVSIPAVPYLSEGQISPDGGTLAGYASGAGTLAVYSIPLASESVVPVPARVNNVTFPALR
jgi:Tol biopolymer transport system component